LRSPPFYCTSLFSVYLLLDEDGDEAPLELEGLLAPDLEGELVDGELALDPLEPEGELALGLDELVLPELAPLEDPLDAEPDESLTPKAASVCRSS